MKKSKKSLEWNKVTPFSKALAMTLFIALPFIAFVLGMKFQRELASNWGQCMFTNSENNYGRNNWRR